MKKSILIILFLSLVYAKAQTQAKFSHKPKGAKTLKILGVNAKIHLEKYSGSEVVIEINDNFYNKPKEAEGLKVISSGKEDNTNVGLNVTEENGIIKVLAARKKLPKYKILVPKNMRLIIRNRSVYASSVYAKGLEAEVEVKMSYGDVKLENVTGPVILNATYGKAQVVFSKVNQNKPSSIVSPYGKVDVTLPESTKANISLSSPYGDIYTDMKIDYPKKESEEWGSVNANNIRGTLNGGGVEIHLSASYSNIYLRKK